MTGQALIASSPVGAAIVCVGAAAWLLAAGDRDEAGRAGELLLGERRSRWPKRGPRRSTAERWWPWLRERPEWLCLLAGGVVAVLGASVLPLLLGAAGVPLLARTRRAGQARRARERRADAVIGLCGLVAGEVRAGRQPGEALVVAVREAGGGADGPGVPEARAPSPGGAGKSVGAAASGRWDGALVAAARFGGDVSAALREAAREPGAEGLLGLAACWRVATDRGAGLAVGLERLADALRAERDQRADLAAQLAGSWSTAVMLAGLPVLGLLLGSALGAEPLKVLLHSGAGLVCLLVGGALEGAGLWWSRRIVRRAERW